MKPESFLPRVQKKHKNYSSERKPMRMKRTEQQAIRDLGTNIAVISF